MILDTDLIETSCSLFADICVIGAGPAGIVIARACAASGLSVLLIESGGLRPDPGSQALCRGAVADPALHAPPDLFRRRGFGGSSVIWGGRCVPLDRLDFRARPWLGLEAAWPIEYDDVKTYWRGAADILELGAPDFDAASAIPGGMKPTIDGFKHPHVSTESIERFSRPTDFGQSYRADMKASRQITLLMRATCIEISMSDSHAQVRAAELRTRRGFAVFAKARSFVLAAGGLEVPRLLLASHRQCSAGLGNAYDQVGRYYMCHIAGTTGIFTAAPKTVTWHGYERDVAGVYCRRRFSIEADAQEALRIGNAVARLHHPRADDPAHASGPLSALYLAKRTLPAEYSRRMQDLDVRRSLMPHVANVIRDGGRTFGFGVHVLRDRIFARRKFPSVIVAPRSGTFSLDVHAEQLPNAASRLRLGNQRDRFGTPELRIDWHYGAEDLRTVRVTVALIAEALRAGGHGTLHFDPAEIDADMLRDGAYGGHHLGGARMSASPRSGVVDANCRVHGIGNLFVAGGAVFPTSGQANPTFTIVALALRLAEHLVSGWAKPQQPGAATTPSRILIKDAVPHAAPLPAYEGAGAMQDS